MIDLALVVCHLIQVCVCVTFIILFSFALPRITEISPEKVLYMLHEGTPNLSAEGFHLFNNSPNVCFDICKIHHFLFG